MGQMWFFPGASESLIVSFVSSDADDSGCVLLNTSRKVRRLSLRGYSLAIVHLSLSYSLHLPGGVEYQLTSKLPVV